jgi:hypothetical protein
MKKNKSKRNILRDQKNIYDSLKVIYLAKIYVL